MKSKREFVSVQISRETSITTALSEKENMVAEKISDAIYWRLSRKLKNYKKGCLVLRTRGMKEFNIETNQEIFFYSIGWGVAKE